MNRFAVLQHARDKDAAPIAKKKKEPTEAKPKKEATQTSGNQRPQVSSMAALKAKLDAPKTVEEAKAQQKAQKKTEGKKTEKKKDVEAAPVEEVAAEEPAAPVEAPKPEAPKLTIAEYRKQMQENSVGAVREARKADTSATKLGALQVDELGVKFIHLQKEKEAPAPAKPAAKKATATKDSAAKDTAASKKNPRKGKVVTDLLAVRSERPEDRRDDRREGGRGRGRGEGRGRGRGFGGRGGRGEAQHADPAAEVAVEAPVEAVPAAGEEVAVTA